MLSLHQACNNPAPRAPPRPQAQQPARQRRARGRVCARARAEAQVDKPTHPVVITDCGVCGMHEPEPMAWVRRGE